MVRKCMADITGAWSSICSGAADSLRDPIDTDASSLPNVDCAAIRDGRIHREQICADNIAHMSKVARLLTVAIYRKRPACATRLQKVTNYGEVRALGRHTRTEHIEISERQRLHSIKSMEQTRVLFSS